MSQLLQAVLTDPAARDTEQLPDVAASVASEYLPWNDAN